MRIKDKMEKSGLKLNVKKKTEKKIMTSGLITSWQTEGEKGKWWQILFSWDFKITADSDCSHEIKRRLLLGRKSMTNLDSVAKSIDFTLPTKVCTVKAMVFPAAMYGYMEKAEW